MRSKKITIDGELFIISLDDLFKVEPITQTDLEELGFVHIDGCRYKRDQWTLYSENNEVFLDCLGRVKLDCKCTNKVMLAILFQSVGLAKEIDVEYLTE